jgi:hypothetical protein
VQPHKPCSQASSHTGSDRWPLLMPYLPRPHTLPHLHALESLAEGRVVGALLNAWEGAVRRCSLLPAAHSAQPQINFQQGAKQGVRAEAARHLATAYDAVWYESANIATATSRPLSPWIRTSLKLLDALGCLADDERGAAPVSVQEGRSQAQDARRYRPRGSAMPMMSVTGAPRPHPAAHHCDPPTLCPRCPPAVFFLFNPHWSHLRSSGSDSSSPAEAAARNNAPAASLRWWRSPRRPACRPSGSIPAAAGGSVHFFYAWVVARDRRVTQRQRRPSTCRGGAGAAARGAPPALLRRGHALRGFHKLWPLSDVLYTTTTFWRCPLAARL